MDRAHNEHSVFFEQLWNAHYVPSLKGIYNSAHYNLISEKNMVHSGSVLLSNANSRMLFLITSMYMCSEVHGSDLNLFNALQTF